MKNILTLKEKSIYPMDSIGQIFQYPPLIYRPAPAQNQAAKTGGYSTISQLEKVIAFQSQEAYLTIVTQEGDYVTLSADSKFRLDFATYNQAGRRRGMSSRLHSETLSMESSQEFTMSVRGGLNEQEIKDIQKVLQSLDKIMNDLLSGRLEQGMARAGKLGNLESLSSIEATLQVEQSISAGGAILAETVSAPYPSSKQMEAFEDPMGPKALEVARQRIMDTLRESDLSPDKLSKIIEKFFLRLSRVLSENGNHHLKPEGIINRLKNNLFKEISRFQ